MKCACSGDVLIIGASPFSPSPEARRLNGVGAAGDRHRHENLRKPSCGFAVEVTVLGELKLKERATSD